MIAGTYTPFTLVTLNGAWGWSLFTTVWALTVIGTLIEVWGGKRLQRWSLALYLLMGWLVVIAFKPLLCNLAAGGGLAYTLGALFYAWDRLRWNHAIWHLFVLAGSVLHFMAVFFYVIPESVGS